jgi:RNA polymerase sigma-70 factor, ECF subfamily
MQQERRGTGEEGAAVRRGDRAVFELLVARHRRELQVHCYRLLGSLEDAEDQVQETFLRAWRGREQFEGRSTVRAWLYRIATNACLDVRLARRRRALPYQLSRPADPGLDQEPSPEATWLQPYPERLLEPAAPAEQEPGTAVITRETIELAFVAALQFLPARQRATLVLRDVLGWSAAEVADAVDTTVPAANSALQRARATMRTQLGARPAWPAAAAAASQERDLIGRLMFALERADAAAIAALLLADARGSMPPYPQWYSGRDVLARTIAHGFALFGGFRVLPTRANRAPAVALYRQPPGSAPSAPFEPVAISVLRLDGGRIAEITSFGSASLFPRFALPETLPAA